MTSVELQNIFELQQYKHCKIVYLFCVVKLIC